VLLKRKKLSPHNYCMIHCYEVVKVGLKHIGFVLLFGMVLGFELRALSRLLGSCLTDLQSPKPTESRTNASLCSVTSDAAF
jgi:hypothetical protein